MIRHAPPHRTIERDRLGTPQGEPTPEQLADDGRCDGVPVVTLAELDAAREARERRLTELAIGHVLPRGGHRRGRAICWIERRVTFRTMRDAVTTLRMNEPAIYRIISGTVKLEGITLKWAA